MPILILIPLAGALLTLLLPRRGQRVAGIAAAVATLAASLSVSWWLFRGGARRHEVGSWDIPLGIHLQADGLSVFMILVTAIVGLTVSVYAGSFFALSEARKGGAAYFWPLWLFLWGFLNGLFLSSDLFNIYVALEGVTLSAVALAALNSDTTSLAGALRYLLAAMLGSLAYLLGVGILYSAYGMLDLQALAAVVEPELATGVAMALMVTGLLLKTALFPLHFWLPPAHSAAPAPVSAVLSALVVKGSFYVVLRLWFTVFDNQLTFAAGQLLGTLGAAAILWGSFQAIRQRRLKLLIAHSTVGQIGYLFLIFPLMSMGSAAMEAAPGLREAWAGGIYHLFSHALAKASLFLSAGILLHAVGNDDLRSIRELAARLPTTAFALGLAGVSLMGLPPSGGFIAKWMILKAILASGQWWWAPVLVLGSLLTAGYVFLILRHIFIPPTGKLRLRSVPRTLEFTALILALLVILIGFRAEELIALLELDAPPFRTEPLLGEGSL